MSITYLSDAQPLSLGLECFVHPAYGRIILRNADAVKLRRAWEDQAARYRSSEFYYRKIWDEFADLAFSIGRVEITANATITLREAGL